MLLQALVKAAPDTGIPRNCRGNKDLTATKPKSPAKAKAEEEAPQPGSRPGGCSSNQAAGRGGNRCNQEPAEKRLLQRHSAIADSDDYIVASGCHETGSLAGARGRTSLTPLAALPMQGKQ